MTTSLLLAVQEGVKLLGTWLQGDRAPTFCRLLARNTARAKPGHLASGTTSDLCFCRSLQDDRFRPSP